MIVLIVLLALVFAWACIATAVAVSAERMHAGAMRGFCDEVERRKELEDRLQASSLSEFRAHRPVAMEAHEPTPSVRYTYDETGLVRGIAEPDDEDE